MSILETISIQGIRSFDHRNPQVLEFLKPVTLILGQNGTGKTTIIECLKYATTGDLPPGSKVGGSFVHDPKIAGESAVKAKVSLELKNLKGDPMTISRALQATQKDKNKQISVQTLDSSIQRLIGGECISMSSKCADINFEITNSLGVSKAVLENVIFCHQEDSNWPLSEAKIVKERFDNLFASARYVKALESIRKIKQEKESSAKLFKVEIGHLKDKVDDINSKTSKKQLLERKSADITIKCDEVKERLKPTEESIQKYHCQYKELCEIQKNKDILVNEKRSTGTRIQELRENISEEMNYTTVELEQQIGDSDFHLSTLKHTISEEEYKNVLLGKEVIAWRSENQSLLLDKGALSSKIAANENLEKELNTSMAQLINEISLPYDELSPLPNIKNLDNHIIDLEANRDQELAQFDEKSNIHQAELESKKLEKTKLEHEIEINRKNLRNKQTELINFENKINAIGEESAKLNTIKEQLIVLNSNLTTCKSSFDANSVQEIIKNLSKNISNLEDQLNETDNAIVACQNEEVIFNEIKSLQQQRIDKDSASKRLRNRHIESLEKLFDDNIPEKNLKRSLDQKLSEIRNKNNASQKSLLDLQTKLGVSNVEFKQLGDKITDRQKLVKRYEEDVNEICGNFELGNSLIEFREKKRKLEEESTTIQSGVSLYAKFKEMLLKNKSDCPLCHREFKEESEIDDLIEEINDKCINIPSKLEEVSREMTIINNKIESLIKLESQSVQIINLKENVLKDLENQYEMKMKNIGELRVSLTQLSNERELCVNNEKIASSILGDVANMEKYNDEIVCIDKSLVNLKQKINQSPEEFREKYESVQSKKKTIQSQISYDKKELETKRKYFQDSLTKENDLTTKINNLETEKLQIQNVLQEFANCHSRKEALKEEIMAIEDQIHSSGERLVPVNNSLGIIRNTYNQILGEKKIAESNANKKIFELKNRVNSIKKTLQEVNKFKQENTNQRLENIEQKITKLTNKIEHNITCQDEGKSRIDELNSKIGNYQMRLRELQDSLKIKQHMTKIDELDKSIEKLELQLVGINLSNMPIEVKKLEDERRKMKGEIDKLETEKIKLTTEIDIIENDLSSDRFSGINSRYLDKLYQLKTSELAIYDLERYYKALDKAILTYHQAKMAEINKILKELWRNTYSGKDVDYLEICSDEDTSAAGSRKRNYNYRVVMIKSNCGARLDMRGRCSAGQKVLASLLIRLALAEVFCLHCGVLALDEPTTNLDQENIANLAFALVEIIKTRSRQKNFQLIVITHDEDFVKLLGRSEFIDKFYKIHSNSSGHSKIDVSGL